MLRYFDMCGRYTLSTPEQALDFLAPVLDESGVPPALEARFNVAPTQLMPMVANRTTRAIELARWGLVPSWAKDPSIGSRMINARAESVAEKPAFKSAFERRRCLVPADGFYEWKTEGKRKQAYWIHLEPRQPFAFAGLWDRWKLPDGDWQTSFTIITCEPNAVCATLHDRMPVVLAPADWERWLTREPLPPEALQDLLAPADATGWVIEQVGEWVNRADHEGPACIESRPAQGTLF
jgi:putative SOS response-associated peptidase YedK